MSRETEHGEPLSVAEASSEGAGEPEDGPEVAEVMGEPRKEAEGSPAEDGPVIRLEHLPDRIHKKRPASGEADARLTLAELSDLSPSRQVMARHGCRNYNCVPCHQ